KAGEVIDALNLAGLYDGFEEVPDFAKMLIESAVVTQANRVSSQRKYQEDGIAVVRQGMDLLQDNVFKSAIEPVAQALKDMSIQEARDIGQLVGSEYPKGIAYNAAGLYEDTAPPTVKMVESASGVLIHELGHLGDFMYKHVLGKIYSHIDMFRQDVERDL